MEPACMGQNKLRHYYAVGSMVTDLLVVCTQAIEGAAKHDELAWNHVGLLQQLPYALFRLHLHLKQLLLQWDHDPIAQREREREKADRALRHKALKERNR
jgi:hypothetical protein